MLAILFKKNVIEKGVDQTGEHHNHHIVNRVRQVMVLKWVAIRGFPNKWISLFVDERICKPRVEVRVVQNRRSEEEEVEKVDYWNEQNKGRAVSPENL